MSFGPPAQAVIAPVPDGMVRPRWSVMIPTFNCAHYLRETLASVLAQDPGPDRMQIEVVDDASSDDPASVIADVGQGRVTLFRQPVNRGHILNFATCLNRARGEIVHLLHGDDLVLPGFYETLGRGFEDPGVGAVFCRWQVINSAGAVTKTAEAEQERPGRLEDALARLASEQRIVTPSIAVRRLVWEHLGGFDPRLLCAEDWEMWVRIAAHYPIWYEPAVLAAYRVHDSSNTSRHLRNAEELRYSRLAIHLFRHLLPPQREAAIRRNALNAYAQSALTNAEEFARNGDRSAMRAHLAAALRLRPSPRVLRKAGRIAWQAIRNGP
jgi:glycosyltransferase involved in cell wall biosynthesis